MLLGWVSWASGTFSKARWMTWFSPVPFLCKHRTKVKPSIINTHSYCCHKPQSCTELRWRLIKVPPTFCYCLALKGSKVMKKHKTTRFGMAWHSVVRKRHFEIIAICRWKVWIGLSCSLCQVSRLLQHKDRTTMALRLHFVVIYALKEDQTFIVWYKRPHFKRTQL